MKIGKLVGLILVAGGAGAFGAEDGLYNRAIRPILSDKCFACHGADSHTREADLRLDVAEAAYENRKDGAAWVPGSPEASLGWKRIVSTDLDAVMPPPESHKALTEDEKTLIRRWIEAGAVYEPHWAYVPIQAVAPPAKGHPIDAFIQRRLAQEGLRPAPQASRADLARRLSLDLTGLPPDPEAVAAILADTRPEDVVMDGWIDELLNSPHFGERMAVPWLDLGPVFGHGGVSRRPESAHFPISGLRDSGVQRK